MDPIIGGLMAGASSLIGSIFSANTSAKNTQEQLFGQSVMQQQSEAFNAQQAQMARDYQTQMSNTAYQRSRADMVAAGLNPVLAAGAGGASTPSGMPASVGTPSVPMPQTRSKLEGLGTAVGQAVNTAVTMKTMDKLTEEVANLEATRHLTQVESGLRGQQTQTEVAETSRRQAEAELAALRRPGAVFSAKQAGDLLRMPDWMRSAAVQGGFVGGKISDTLSPLTDLITSARGVKGLLSPY